MGWTDERVELLQKLWQDGLSAGTIAERLGGVTRNAVIGKVHRLGLSRRATLSKPQCAVPKAPRLARPAAVLPALPARREKPVAAPPAPVRYGEEVPGSVVLLSLDVHMCRWPIGDPQEKGFSYCGRQADGPYCREHAQLAYRPARAKRKAGAAELARALHRYL